MTEEANQMHPKPIVYGMAENVGPTELTGELIYQFDARLITAIETHIGPHVDAVETMNAIVEGAVQRAVQSIVNEMTQAAEMAMQLGGISLPFGLDPMYAEQEEEISQGMTLDEWQAWTDQLIRESQQADDEP